MKGKKKKQRNRKHINTRKVLKFEVKENEMKSAGKPIQRSGICTAGRENKKVTAL